MELKILKEKENPLLERTEITAKSSFKTTPSRETICKEIGKQKGVKPELVVIRKIKQLFGKHETEINLVIYKNNEAMKKTEEKYFLERSQKKKKETKKDNENKEQNKKEEGQDKKEESK